MEPGYNCKDDQIAMGRDLLFADEEVLSVFDMDFEAYYQKGFRGVIFDIDNTLTGHDAPPEKRSGEIVERLQKMGYIVTIVSNNDKERVSKFADEIGAPYVYKAGKPLARGYERALDMMGTKPQETIAIGDQIFTDVLGAKRAGIYAVLTKKLYFREPWYIHLKRILELPVLAVGKLKNRKKNKR